MSIRRQSTVGSLQDEREVHRMEKLLGKFKDKTPPALVNLFKLLAPFIKAFCVVLNVVGPYIIKLYSALFAIYKRLPKNVVAMLLGLAFTFFGGLFAVTFAAIEAFRELGGSDVYTALEDLKIDFDIVQTANKKDDEVDDNKNGIKDVKEIPSHQLVSRKLLLVLRSVDPDRVNHAMAGLYKGFTGVLVVLRFRFARVIALAVSIADHMRPLASRILAPPLAFLIPKEYHKWISTMINVLCRTVATTIAWKIQRVLSTIQSAIKGGLMFARALVRFLHENRIISFDDESTYLDEILGWALAAGGIYVQIHMNWNLPLLVDLFLWPLHVSERVLIWSVTWMDASPSEKGM
ncbi:hypothetical protein JKP88DRAFT_348379 [Tribonema minus]|uniref:Uncharacterized protein n=1 Tax=Tribonema minus TaxID=303371 RepID=A0A835Z0S9_9STRA|nr:hypothetical protein JKP88DRAFT_348379 [Tribonema minus]